MEVKSYFLKRLIQHQKITLLWPQANGEIERFMQPVTKVIRAAYMEQNVWVAALREFAFAYCVTPHSSSNIPPGDFMFKPCIPYFIPDANNKLDHIDLEEKFEFNDRRKKELNIDYATSRRHAKPCQLSVGNCALVKRSHKNKLISPFNPYPYHIIARCLVAQGSMFTAKKSETDHELTRNRTHFKSIPKQVIEPPVITDSEQEEEWIARFDGNLEPELIPVSPPNDHSVSIENTSPPRKVYPRRFRRPAHEWREY